MRKTAIIVASAAAGMLALAACSHGTPQNQEQATSNAVEQNADINQPVPVFQHSDIRATAISIEAIQALGEQTTSFFFNQGVRNPIFSCPSLGEPIASTTEITNPTQAYARQGVDGMVPIGNMDPNEIYAGDSTGTYVLCVAADGTPYAQYWEGFVDSVSGPATWDTTTGQLVVTGQPTMPSCTTAASGSTSAKTTCVK